MVEAEADDRQAVRNVWIDQEMCAASRPPVRLLRDTIITGIGAGLATSFLLRRSDAGDWMVAEFYDLRQRLITKAEVCHARRPNQCLLAWAIGSFMVSQIMVGAVVAPLLAHFWPVMWRGV